MGQHPGRAATGGAPQAGRACRWAQSRSPSRSTRPSATQAAPTCAATAQVGRRSPARAHAAARCASPRPAPPMRAMSACGRRRRRPCRRRRACCPASRGCPGRGAPAWPPTPARRPAAPRRSVCACAAPAAPERRLKAVFAEDHCQTTPQQTESAAQTSLASLQQPGAAPGLSHRPAARGCLHVPAYQQPLGAHDNRLVRARLLMLSASWEGSRHKQGHASWATRRSPGLPGALGQRPSVARTGPAASRAPGPADVARIMCCAGGAADRPGSEPAPPAHSPPAPPTRSPPLPASLPPKPPAPKPRAPPSPPKPLPV